MTNKKSTNVSLDDVADVAGLIGTELESLRENGGCVAVYAKRDFANDLFIELIQYGYGFSYADFDGLDDLVKDRIYLMMIDNECNVSIEPAINSNGVIIAHDASTVLIYIDDCPQKIAEFNEDDDCKIIYFDLDGNSTVNNVNKAKVQIKHNGSGDVVGFTCDDTSDDGCSYHFSCYSTDAEIVKKYAKAYGINF